MRVRSSCANWASLVAAVAMLGVAVPAVGQTPVCEIPLIIQSAGTPANVMIVLDSSGSMNSAIYHPAYDETVTWSGSFTTDRTYYVGSNGWYDPNDFYWRWSNSPDAPLVKSDQGESGRYKGNYLNWVYFHATDAQRAALPQATRIQVAKAAVMSMLWNVPELRYGLTIFNYETGGTRLNDIADPIPDIMTEVTNLVANDWTPLAETMAEVAEYFESTGSGAPIQYPCQQSFVILVTDGLPTKDDDDLPSWVADFDGDGNDPGSCPGDGCTDWLDDVTYYMANTDLQTGSGMDGDQNVVTYVVGFEIEAPVLSDAAINGDGDFFTASNLPTLLNTLGSILGDILIRTSAGTSAAVVSAEQTTSDKLIRANFVPGFWAGLLEAYQTPYNDGDQPVWEAGSILQQRNPGTRDMFTWGGSSKIDFMESEATEIGALMGVSEGDAQKTIRWVRGEYVPGKRDMDGWKLGDIVYSSPLIVGSPSEFFIDEGYQNFLANNEFRTPVAYVGGNDGQLHAFDLDNGNELWSFLPKAILHKLPDLGDPDYCHMTFVDLTPRAFDVKLNNTWRTVLVGGLRTGGDSYFALDVTTPTNADNVPVLWETSLPKLGSSFTEPAIVRKANATYMWMGSAPDPGGDAYVAAVDIATGIDQSMPTDKVGGTHSDFNMTGAAVTWDSDYDDITDYLYFGTLAGDIWKADVTDSSPTNWTFSMIYDGDQPIQGRPDVAVAPNGDKLVYFGTGRYVDASDLVSTNTNSFIMVRDDGSGTVVTKSELIDQTSSINDVSGQPGWFFDLTAESGERAIEPPVVAAGVVYFTSFAPTFQPCTAGGHSYLYAVHYLDGSAPTSEGESGGTSGRIAEDLGDGVASKVIVDILNEQIIVQTSDARLTIADLTVAPQRVTVRAWREKF